MVATLCFALHSALTRARATDSCRTADSVQHDTREREVNAVAAEVGKMLKIVCFDAPRPDQNDARHDESSGAGELRNLSPYLRPDLQISSQCQMNDSRKQDINMPRPHQQAQILRDDVLVGKIDAHVPTRHRKNDEQQNAEDEVKPFHGGELRLTILRS